MDCKMYYFYLAQETPTHLINSANLHFVRGRTFCVDWQELSKLKWIIMTLWSVSLTSIQGALYKQDIVLQIRKQHNT